jgi:cytochrome c oxidase subunit IV
MEVQWTRPLLSLLSFRTSDRYLETLDALFVDKFVYGHAWTSFMTTCLKTWRRDCCSSAMLLLLHILCIFQPVSTILAYASSLLASTSFLTGMLLIHRHEELEYAEAHEAQTYLSAVRSDYFKFQGVAAAYSLPRVLSLIGLITFFSQWLVLIWENNSQIYAIPLIFLVLAFFLCLQQTTRTSEATLLRTLISQTANIFKYTSNEEKDSIV